jgi:hypothetical protein
LPYFSNNTYYQLCKSIHFNGSLEPDYPAPRAGIYRCEKCKLEVVRQQGEALPSEQNCVRHGAIAEHIDPKVSEVRWRLVAATITHF